MNPKYDKLNAQIDKWIFNGEYQKILDTLLDIPRSDYDTEMTGLLARTYNSMGQYRKAITLLQSIEDKCQDDPNWFYRMGTALYYTGDKEEAAYMFQKVVEMEPDDVDAHEFLYRCTSNYKERVEQFWKWFAQHEEKLTDLWEKELSKQNFMELLSEGLNLQDPEASLEITDKPYEIILLIKGIDERYYLYPYLIAQMPERFRGKWTFRIGHQATRMHKVELVFEDGKKEKLSSIKVRPVLHQENGTFSITYFANMFNGLPLGFNLNNVFWSMMELCIGEEFSFLHVTRVDQTSIEEEDMIPLTDLKNAMLHSLEQVGQKPKKTVHDIQFDYQDTPSIEESFVNLRLDIREGRSNYPLLVRDYYHYDIERILGMLGRGVKAAFLAIPYEAENDLEYEHVLRGCKDLRNLIQRDLLEDSDTHPGTGMVLGEAIGEECMYIDLLLFDELNFIRELKEMAEPYPFTIIMSDFRQGSWYTLIKKHGNNPNFNRYLNRCLPRTDI